MFLKRNSLEVAFNHYNPKILSLFESNIDLQYVIEEYGVANYVVNYMSKVEGGMSKLLREAAQDITQGNASVRDRLRRVFLNGNLISAQEAAYHCLSLSLSKSSRGCIFINTSPPDERVKMLKSKSELEKMSVDSTEIYMEGIFEKYEKRPKHLEHLCLAEFGTLYHKIKPCSDFNDDADPRDEYKEREKPKILRFRRYKLSEDENNYYREQVLLFLPWRNGTSDVVNCSAKYALNEQEIRENKKKFSIMDDEVLDNALENANMISDPDSDLDSSLANPLLTDQRIDILR